MRATVELAFADVVVMSTSVLLLIFGVILGSRRDAASIPALVSGLAIAATGTGLLEIMFLGSVAAKYGLSTTSLAWAAGVPGLLVLGYLLRERYSATGARTLPHYLENRGGRGLGTVAGALFAVTALAIGAIVLQQSGRVLAPLLGWSSATVVLAIAVPVAAYVALGGLSVVMYAQAIQLAVILLGVGGLAWVALVAADGWLGLQMRLTVLAHVRSVPPEALTSIWPTGLATASNPTGIGYLPFLLGTGVILSIAYWGMDYAVVQRTLAAGAGARRAITIAVLMRVILPVVIVAAGTVAVTLGAGSGYALGGVSQGYVPPRMTAGGLPMVDAMGRTILDFEMGIPVLMKNILPPGFFGLGIAALVAAAMSTLSAALTVVSSAVTRDIRFSFASGWSEGAVAVAGAAVVTAVALGLRPADQMAETAAMAIPFIHAPVLGATASLIVRRAGSGWVSALAIVCGLAAALLHHSLSHAPGAGAGFGAPFGGVAWMYPTPIARGIWTAMTGASASFAVALAGSFLIKSGNRK